MTGSASGRFDGRGDRDTFRVRLEAGKTYQIGTENNGRVETVQLPDGTPLILPVLFSNFVAPVTGDYWVTVTGSSVSPLYTVNAIELNDPTPASIATPLALSVGESKSADWTPNSRDDWYAVNLVAGQSYFLKSSGTNDTLYLTNSAGKLITVQDSQLHFTATETETYYAGIHNRGDYTLSLETVADDRGETPGSAGVLAIGAPANGLWETVNDSDWYAITLTAGESYRFALSTANAPMPGTKIYDASGGIILASSTGTDGATIFAPKTSGTYYVSASTGAGYYTPNGSWSYSLSATRLDDDVLGNELTSSVLTIGTPTTGNWHSAGDADWFAVTLAAGQAYQFSIDFNVALASMVLYNSAGNQVSPSSSSLVQTVAMAGTYYLGVVGRSDASYAVTATTFVDDFANNRMTVGTLAVGGTATGLLEVDFDVDWFAVQLEAGKSYRFSATPFATSLIRDAQGNMLTDPDGGGDYFSPLVSGTYYLEATGYAGDYTVSIVRAPDDYREDMISHGVIRRNTMGNDTAEIFTSSDDHDWFAGQGGNDRFVAGAGYDVFIGGTGIDTIDFGQFAAGVNVSLRTGGLYENGVARVGFSQTENVEGSSYDDAIEGDLTANALYGKNGNDTLTGLGGNDTIDGGAGIDRAVFTGNRADYRVVMEGPGYRVTDLRQGANDGSDLVTNVEALVFADGEIIPLPFPGADTDFRLVTVNGFAGGVGGYGTVFGTNGFQDITVLDGSTSIVFDGSFARGGDVLRLQGNAADYKVSIAGSNVLLTAENFAIAVPIGTAGLPIVFADGVRTLVYDAGLGSVRIGAQAFSETAQITAAPDGTVLPGGGDPSVSGRIALSSDITAPVTVAGKINVFGTNLADEITLEKGSFVLDGSFSRGGDTIHLLGPTSGFKAHIAGSNLVLTSADTTLTIPVGLNPAALDFAGNVIALRYDTAMGAIRIGDQSITATTLETADPLVSSALALATQSFA